jgi:RNA polymerase sigma-70 factor, ECF subfamily
VTEQTILDARNGNRVARDELVRALQDIWYRFCLSLLRNNTLALDATQETALRFLRDLSKFDRRSSIKTWSLGIALNVVREIRRSRNATGAEETPDREDPGASPLQLAERSEATGMVRQLLADLPERQREALLLRFFEDRSVEQTGQIMNVAPGTVKATVHQALRALRKHFERRSDT